jgi:hypothetical protein
VAATRTRPPTPGCGRNGASGGGGRGIYMGTTARDRAIRCLLVSIRPRQGAGPSSSCVLRFAAPRLPARRCLAARAQTAPAA